MPRITFFFVGLLMIIGGAFLTSPQASPVWLFWLAGIALWYVGFAFAIAGLLIFLAARLAVREHQAFGREHEAFAKTGRDATMTVLHLGNFDNGNSPRGLIREVPAMGTFVL